MASKVNQRVRILKLRPSAREFHTIEGYLSKIHEVLRNFVERNRNGKTAKIQLKLRLDMMKYTPENNLIKSTPTFASNMLPVQTSKETTIVLKKMYQSLASNVENFLQMGSGWTLNQIIFLECQLVKCKKICWRFTSTYHHFTIGNSEQKRNIKHVRHTKRLVFSLCNSSLFIEPSLAVSSWKSESLPKKGGRIGTSACTDGCW